MMMESILEIFFRTVNDCSETKGLFGSGSLAGDVRSVVFCCYLRLRLTFSSLSPTSEKLPGSCMMHEYQLADERA